MIRMAKTENGTLRGLPSSDARITVYKGIPFAAPPVGKNRWKAPQRCEDWDGIRDAYTYGPISMQDTPGLGTDVYCREWHVDSDIPMSEDCLYLNVWTPAKTPDEKLPVFIWIYGGAFQWGYTAEMEFEADRLCRRGMIVVSMGYRLGAFGFLAHPELTAESPKTPTNFGLLDQQAAIKWVRRNISAFGGDPDRITLGGQSAGGASVISQIACEDNYEDVKGAAIISGIIRPAYFVDEFFTPGDLSKDEMLGQEFIEFLGVQNIAEARELDAIYIRDKYAEFAMDHMRMSPCIDGHFLKDEPYKCLVNNECANIPLFVGNTTDEFIMTISAKNEDELAIKAKELFGDKAKEFLDFEESKIYVDGGFAPVGSLESNIKAAIELKHEKGYDRDCYYYKFASDIPGEDNPGTFHSVDLWFFFETLMKSPRPFVGRHYDLARNMCNYLANFIKTGNPNGVDADGTTMPEWKPYTKDNKNEMVFESEGPRACVDSNKRTEFYIENVKRGLQ